MVSARTHGTIDARFGRAGDTACVNTLDLALLGCGNMGLAIVRGAIEQGVLRADGVLGIDPSPDARERAAALGMRVTENATEARDAAHLLLAVKPQSFDGLAHALAPLGTACQVISVMSGWTRLRIGTSLRLRDGAHRVVRAMPNLPATIGAGVTAIARDGPSAHGAHDAGVARDPGAHASISSPMEFAESLFRAVGDVVFVDESLIDAVTAVSGSGPAYAFLLAEAMMDAAQRLGFDAHTARQLVIGTLDGAVALLQQDARAPAELRDAVTSRGGTTEAATRVWMERKIPEGIVDALLAAAARAAELGRTPMR